MSTSVINLSTGESYDEPIRRAAGALADGRLVIFPTETVYGVAARADIEDARQRLQRVKDRAAGKPFTVHIASRSDVARYVPDLPAVAKRFVKKAWPGPLTMVLSTKDPHDTPIAAKHDRATVDWLYHGHTVALRFPDNQIAIDLLSRTTGPIVAASANRAGNTPPRNVDAAVAELDGDVELALDGGPARYNQSSTIIEIDDGGYHILRRGVYDERMLKSFAKINLLFVCTGNTCRSPMASGIAGNLIAKQIGCDPNHLADRDVHVTSAGTFAVPGMPAADHAVEVLQERGIDITSHQSQPLTAELINQADYIYAMTASHESCIVDLAGPNGACIQRLLDSEDIDDPIGGDRATYAKCAETIEKAIAARLEEVEL